MDISIKIGTNGHKMKSKPTKWKDIEICLVNPNHFTDHLVSLKK
jgi:hypothetical protein